MITLLLAQKADITLKNKKGETPHDLAIRLGRKDLADMLKLPLN